ncbi:MAG: glycosyltransferase [Xanthomonadales bacterium]|nr:glycosyltransferase [Xanthomonadales bacterium]
MRILHLGKYYAPQRGGIERHLQDLCEWFVGQGHRVTALVHQVAGHWRSANETTNNVDICRAACIAAPLYAPISPTFPMHLSRLIRRLDPEVLHLHLPNPSCFWALFNPRARALPWVVHWHADVSADMPDWRVRAAYRIYRPFEQAILARASAIIVTSQAYLDASAALGNWKDKCTVIPLGIAEIAEYRGTAPIWPRPDHLRLLAVGRLSHYKGFAVLLEALARTPAANLILIGKGEESGRLRAQVTRLGLADRVSLVGELSEPELLAAYAAADVLVLPSLDRSEAFGLVLLEAMRAGVAIIASDIPGSGTGQVIVNEHSGLLVKPGDVDALAAALMRMSDPALRASLADAGHRRWREGFTLAKSAQAVLAIYQRLRDAHPKAARRAD